jgi:hypothetical protein
MKNIHIGFILFLIACSGYYGYNEFNENTYYRVYTLNEQYIGNITVNENEYNDVYIMNVTLMKGRDVNYTSPMAFHPYGCLCDCGNMTEILDYFTPYERQILYFANEHETRQDFAEGEHIVAHWKGNRITSVYNESEFEEIYMTAYCKAVDNYYN